MSSNNFLIVISGPTAVGKTELCVSLAKRLNCEIISADSRQFYRELNVGTAKPTSEEMQGVRHYFIDYIPVQKELSSGAFELEALDVISNIFENNDRTILAGGSGLYIQAVCDGMNDIPKVSLAYRDSLYKELEEHGLDPLLQELKTKDLVYYQAVDRSNPQRIIRALEVCRATGKPYSYFREDKKTQRPFHIIKVGLDREREDLFERINTRVDQMMQDGLLEEAKNLYRFRHLNALKTVGYKELFEYMDHQYDLSEAIRLIKRNTRRYAKRQLTWFKKDQEFTWFHPEDEEGILNYIQSGMSSM